MTETQITQDTTHHRFCEISASLYCLVAANSSLDNDTCYRESGTLPCEFVSVALWSL
jgi:hypothetical protein